MNIFLFFYLLGCIFFYYTLGSTVGTSNNPYILVDNFKQPFTNKKIQKIHRSLNKHGGFDLTLNLTLNNPYNYNGEYCVFCLTKGKFKYNETDLCKYMDMGVIWRDRYLKFLLRGSRTNINCNNMFTEVFLDRSINGGVFKYIFDGKSRTISLNNKTIISQKVLGTENLSNWADEHNILIGPQKISGREKELTIHTIKLSGLNSINENKKNNHVYTKKFKPNSVLSKIPSEHMREKFCLFNDAKMRIPYFKREKDQRIYYRIQLVPASEYASHSCKFNKCYDKNTIINPLYLGICTPRKLNVKTGQNDLCETMEGDSITIYDYRDQNHVFVDDFWHPAMIESNCSSMIIGSFVDKSKDSNIYTIPFFMQFLIHQNTKSQPTTFAFKNRDIETQDLQLNHYSSHYVGGCPTGLFYDEYIFGTCVSSFYWYCSVGWMWLRWLIIAGLVSLAVWVIVWFYYNKSVISHKKEKKKKKGKTKKITEHHLDTRNTIYKHKKYFDPTYFEH